MQEQELNIGVTHIFQHIFQLFVPGGNGAIEVSYDPVITYGLHLTFKKKKK